MFDVGFWELVVIFGLGLLILGPEKLPRVASKIGRWVGKARRTAGDLRRQLERELDFDELAGNKTYSRPKPPPPASPAATAPPMTDHAPPDDDNVDRPPDSVTADPLTGTPTDSAPPPPSMEEAAPEPVATSDSK